MNDDPLAEYGPVIFPPRQRPTIAALEDILEREDDVPITILPNGEIRAATDEEIAASKAGKPTKPLTMRENLGGEYAFA